MGTGFDRIAPVYDFASRLLFGGLLHRSAIALIDELPFCEQALIVGSGTGRFLCELAMSGRAGRILCVDASGAMLSRAEKRYLAAGLDPSLVEFVHAPVEHLPQNLRFDLICTNYFLDLYDSAELARIVELLSGALHPRGLWYCTDFTNGNAVRVRLSYAVFRRLCGLSAHRLPDYKRAFARAGLTPILLRDHKNGLARTTILRKTTARGHTTGSRSSRSTSAETI